jgi:hypothetical protein
MGALKYDGGTMEKRMEELERKIKLLMEADVVSDQASLIIVQSVTEVFKKVNEITERLNILTKMVEGVTWVSGRRN